MTRNSVNPIYADITSIDRRKAGVYIRSVARPRGKRSTSWKVDAIIRAFTRPVSPPRRENCFPYPKGNGIECLENYHRSSVSNFDAGQPPSFLPPKLFHSIGENSFICRLSLSLSSLNSRSSRVSSSVEIPCFVWSNVELRSEDERARSRNFFACCVMVETLWEFRSKSMRISLFYHSKQNCLHFWGLHKYDYWNDVFRGCFYRFFNPLGAWFIDAIKHHCIYREIRDTRT